jgi:starvation-inducible outer membrane lipoprotein
MSKILSLISLFTLFVLTLSACSTPKVTEQEQTTQVEQYSSDNGSQQKQCNHSVVIQNNGKTETHQSSKC